jgi:hypothetical protein
VSFATILLTLSHKEDPVSKSNDDSSHGNLLKYFVAPLLETDVVLVGEDILGQAEKWISACEQCSNLAELSFEELLDAITGCDPVTTDYLMCRTARCPSCNREVTEKSLILS